MLVVVPAACTLASIVDDGGGRLLPFSAQYCTLLYKGLSPFSFASDASTDLELLLSASSAETPLAYVIESPSPHFPLHLQIWLSEVNFVGILARW